MIIRPTGNRTLVRVVLQRHQHRPLHSTMIRSMSVLIDAACHQNIDQGERYRRHSSTASSGMNMNMMTFPVRGSSLLTTSTTNTITTKTILSFGNLEASEEMDDDGG